VPAAIDDEIIATINIQRIAHIPFPIALANYVASDGSQVYYTTLLFFVLVVETRIQPADSDSPNDHQTIVRTTYHVGGPRFSLWLFPILRRLLRNNYELLMSEDLPMRDQRGRLRSVGYRFASDGRARTFIETTDLAVNNVVPPPPVHGDAIVVDLQQLVADGQSLTVGDGPAGLRIIRESDTTFMVFDRVCTHEGACLDTADIRQGALLCPWHAKRVKPLAMLNIDPSSDAKTITLQGGYSLSLYGTSCTIIGVP
jgi:hypothetical protein